MGAWTVKNMKTRTGFVSNSSSSSFVVLLPDNFDWEKEVDSFIENGLNKNGGIDKDRFKAYFKECIENDYFGEYDSYTSLERCLLFLRIMF